MAARLLRTCSTNINYAVDSLPDSSPPSKASIQQLKSQKLKSPLVMKSHSAVKLKKPAVSLESRLPEVPDYTPMEDHYPLHSTYNWLPPALYDISAISPASFFKFFFTEKLFDIIAINTNAYAAKK